MCTHACPPPRVVVLNWQGNSWRGISSHHRPHGSGFSTRPAAVWGGRGPRLRSLLPLPPVLLPAGDSGALRPDCGGSLWLHLHLHLPGGADHLREKRKSVRSRTLQDFYCCINIYLLIMQLWMDLKSTSQATPEQRGVIITLCWKSQNMYQVVCVCMCICLKYPSDNSRVDYWADLLRTLQRAKGIKMQSESSVKNNNGLMTCICPW